MAVGRLSLYFINRITTKPIFHRYLSTRANVLEDEPEPVEEASTSEQQGNNDTPVDFRYAFPDFVPERQFDRRHHIKERLERQDMLQRRIRLQIPEFYAGSIVAVTNSDPYSSGRRNRFLGICIQRWGSGLSHYFILRNVIEGMGVEVKYELYNPLIQNIEVIKLEKRLDEELFYLRDALPEYSYFPQNMEPVPHPPGAPVPINTTKVKLKLKATQNAWMMRWEQYDLAGVDYSTVWDYLSWIRKKKYLRAKITPWLKYDVIKEYRTGVTREDEERIYKEMSEFQEKNALVHRGKRQNLFFHHDKKRY